MVGNSKVVTSSQEGIHPRLEKLLQRYQATEWRQPIRTHNVAAFEQVLPLLTSALESGKSLILDSGCGTGWSSVALAAQYPASLVIGIDRSQDRLQRQDKVAVPDNCLLIRADCEDLWRLFVEQEIRFEQHYLFYPNPYPKPKDVQKRWYGHPVVTLLSQLSSSIECRSNWRQYIDDFAFVLAELGYSVSINKFAELESPVSPFEKKYLDSGQACYGLSAGLTH